MNIQFIKNKSKIYNTRRENSCKKLKSKGIIVFLLCLFFLIGIFIGSNYFKNIIDSNYFNENPNILEDISLLNSDINKKSLFLEILFRNVIMLILMWIVGLSILGVPILFFFVLYDGFSLGITIVYILNTFGFYEGYTFLFSRMFLITIINTAIMILLLYSAIRVTFNILKQKSNIKSEFIRHSLVCVFMLILLVFSSTIEVFVNIK